MHSIFFFQQREEADWTLLLRKDKISVPGARKQFSNKKKLKIFIFLDNSRKFFSTDLQAKMHGQFGVDFVEFCNLDILSIASKRNRRKIASKSEIATHVETDEIILLMELN